jgi:BirA family biotin operon repressor/biotin-[acetyl-CoA-carboxylase] ligase
VTGPRGAGWLPLLAGLALARALREVSREAGHELQPRLKWPNDVLLADDGDRKVSGILCELVTLAPEVQGTGTSFRGAGDVPLPSLRGADTSFRSAVVVGTGVNVDQTREELPVDSATSTALAGARVGREALVVRYLQELAALLGAEPSTGGAAGSAGATWSAVALGGVGAGPVAAAYRAECWTLGQHVRVHLPSGAAVEGEAVAVDDDGSLVVATSEGTRSFAAGDVVHVRRP